MPDPNAQAPFDIRCEWGENGVAALAPGSDAVVIVDVMSFSTAVVVATSRDAAVYPFPMKGQAARAFAAEQGALCAGPRRDSGSGEYSLSPVSLRKLPRGSRLVLPSPNGSTLTLRTGETPTFAGCFRSARAVAHAASAIGPRVSVIPCGERWVHDQSLRPALEDWLGAGAVIEHLVGTHSPEALAAREAFRTAKPTLETTLRACASGVELTSAGFADDITPIAELNVGDIAPRVRDGAYRR